MKLRHRVAWYANILFVSLVFFGTVIPDVVADIGGVVSLAGLVYWAALTLKDLERSRLETFGAWFTLPGIPMALALGFFVLDRATSPFFWLFFICIVVPVYCSFIPAFWAMWKRLDERPAS